MRTPLPPSPRTFVSCVLCLVRVAARVHFAGPAKGQAFVSGSGGIYGKLDPKPLSRQRALHALAGKLCCTVEREGYLLSIYKLTSFLSSQNEWYSLEPSFVFPDTCSTATLYKLFFLPPLLPPFLPSSDVGCSVCSASVILIYI